MQESTEKFLKKKVPVFNLYMKNLFNGSISQILPCFDNSKLYFHINRNDSKVILRLYFKFVIKILSEMKEQIMFLFIICFVYLLLGISM